MQIFLINWRSSRGTNYIKKGVTAVLWLGAYWCVLEKCQDRLGKTLQKQVLLLIILGRFFKVIVIISSRKREITQNWSTFRMLACPRKMTEVRQCSEKLQKPQTNFPICWFIHIANLKYSTENSAWEAELPTSNATWYGISCCLQKSPSWI